MDQKSIRGSYLVWELSLSCNWLVILNLPAFNCLNKSNNTLIHRRIGLTNEVPFLATNQLGQWRECQGDQLLLLGSVATDREVEVEGEAIHLSR